MLEKRKYIWMVLSVTVILVTAGIVTRAVLISKGRNTAGTPETLQTISTAGPDNKLAGEAQALQAEKVKPDIIRYTVKTGDTLESIGAEHGISASAIAASNGISQDSIIREGQEIAFPSVKGIVYKVRKGDTLWDIATTYDINVDDIASINGMGSGDSVSIGQQIIIPGAEKLKTEKVPVKIVVSKTKTAVKVASRGGSVSSKGLWPVSGPVTSGFGSRWGRLHKGIDIGVPIGTNVKAFKSGTVEYSGWANSFGNLIIINHGGGLKTYYGHNSKLLVKAGQVVTKGQHIAESGNTGDSTGPHCHFEIRMNDVPVNPLKYL
jgi:murein DD-endopeptidase MepM/ murein hydrolase activator NlpD